VLIGGLSRAIYSAEDESAGLSGAPGDLRQHHQNTINSLRDCQYRCP
jgi:hypothetical protein